MSFCLNRCDEDGFIIGQEGDWTFIDWADIDKTGAVCAEQMLFVRSLEAFADCAELICEDDARCRSLAAKCRKKIEQLFRDEEKGAYIDSFASGNRSVTRQTNIFALIFGFADEKRMESIANSVLRNNNVAPITTPYFKFYELDALCRLGCVEEVLEGIRSYWGGMLELGANTFWEEFNPTRNIMLCMETVMARVYAMLGELVLFTCLDAIYWGCVL